VDIHEIYEVIYFQFPVQTPQRQVM